MSIRIATYEDLDLVVSLGMKFLEQTPYKDYADELSIRTLAADIIGTSNEQGIALLYEDYGMLLAVASKSLFSPHKTATEIGWYVSPDERGKEAGKQLLEAFEYWAQKVGCKYITMISLDDRVGKFYEKKGYSLLERAYMKVL